MQTDPFTELQSLYHNLRQVTQKREHWSGPATRDQLVAVNALLNRALEDRSRENRLAVVTILTHYNDIIASTADLTKWDASCLINWLLNDEVTWEVRENAKSTIAYIEHCVRIDGGRALQDTLESEDTAPQPAPSDSW